jgi:hypothetical protein
MDNTGTHKKYSAMSFTTEHKSTMGARHQTTMRVWLEPYTSFYNNFHKSMLFPVCIEHTWDAMHHGIDRQKAMAEYIDSSIVKDPTIMILHFTAR